MNNERPISPANIKVGKFTVIGLESGRPMKSRYDFEYLDPDMPLLAQLREEERLDDVVAPARSEFEKMLLLRRWSKQWDQSGPQPWAPANALQVLEWVRSGKSGNFCVYFTHVFVQACWAMGMPARYCYVHEYRNHSHASSEVWSNEYRKWIIMDSDFNMHFLRGRFRERDTYGSDRSLRSEPLNCLDLHRAAREGWVQEVVPVQDAGGLEFDAATKLTDIMRGFGFVLDYEATLREGMWEMPWAKRKFLHWTDNDPLSEFMKGEFEAIVKGMGPGNECLYTNSEEDFYWPLNETVLERPALESLVGEDTLLLNFNSFTPHFRRFLVSVNGAEWRPLEPKTKEGHQVSGEYPWRLTERLNTLRIRSENNAGCLGPVAEVQIVGSRKYVPPQYAGKWAIDLKSGGGVPSGPIAAGKDCLYVSNRMGGEILRYSPEGALLSRSGESGTGPGQFDNLRGIAVAPDRSLYLADTGNCRIQKLMPDGKPILSWGEPGFGEGQFMDLHMLAVDAGGNVYATESGFIPSKDWPLNGKPYDIGGYTHAHPRDHFRPGTDFTRLSRVQKFTSDGNFLLSWGSWGTAPGEFRTPVGIAVTPDGNVLVVDMGNCRLQRFTPEGKFLSAWGERGTHPGQLLFPTGIALDPEGDVYVADEGNRRLQKFTPEGQFLSERTFALNPEMPLIRPHSLAVVGDRLYVADIFRLWVCSFVVG